MDITEICRLGEAKDDKTRLVLVTLSENEKKRGLLSKFFHLKESQKFNNIKINHDKTKQEREESKKLYEEAKRQEAAHVGKLLVQGARATLVPENIEDQKKAIKYSSPQNRSSNQEQILSRTKRNKWYYVFLYKC